MKKVLSFLVVTAIAFFAVNCGGSGGGNTPASIEKAMYSQLQKGNYEKAVEIMVENLDNEDKEVSAEEKAQFVAAFAEKAKQSNEAQGGIKSFEIVEEVISEDGLSATVSTKVVYGNGKEDTNTSKYVNKDGKWKMSLGK
jgi:hypothetical protein